LTLSALEDATDISSSFLSLVEQGKSDISIGRLMRLVQFYGVDLDDLVATEQSQRPDLEVTRAGRGATVRSSSEGIELAVLAQRGGWELHPIMCTHAPGATTPADPAPGIECFLFVVDGTFELDFGDDDPVRLDAGDSARYRNPGSHVVTNVGSTPGRLLAVSMSSERGGRGQRLFDPVAAVQRVGR